MNRQAGFTLIELIAVIVILAILSSTAIPRFNNLEGEASFAQVKNIASRLENASSLNHAVDMAIEAKLTNITEEPFINISNCTDAAGLLLSTSLPLGYSIAANGSIEDQESRVCILSGLNGSHANFVLTGTQGGLDYL